MERRNNREQNKNCEKSTTYGDERRDRNRQRRRRVPPPFAHITSEPARHDTFGGQQANNVQERHFDERIKLDQRHRIQQPGPRMARGNRKRKKTSADACGVPRRTLLQESAARASSCPHPTTYNCREILWGVWSHCPLRSRSQRERLWGLCPRGRQREREVQPDCEFESTAAGSNVVASIRMQRRRLGCMTRHGTARHDTARVHSLTVAELLTPTPTAR